jgi:uncharacterized protein
MTAEPRKLQDDETLAVELTAVLKQGDVDRLRGLLAADPWLATCVVVSPRGSGRNGGRTSLHLFADWPGHCPNPQAIVKMLVAAGAELNAPGVGMRHRETALHWAASNDDVALVDVLLDAGADIEREGSSIDGGSPLSCAVGYGQWQAARRLVERGARTLLWHEAALGLMPAITRSIDADPPLRGAQLSGPFWNACHGGQFAAAQYLLAHGADLNWSAPWSGETPLDIAEQAGWTDVVAWLTQQGATRGKKSA